MSSIRLLLKALAIAGVIPSMENLMNRSSSFRIFNAICSDSPSSLSALLLSSVVGNGGNLLYPENLESCSGERPDCTLGSGTRNLGLAATRGPDLDYEIGNFLLPQLFSHEISSLHCCIWT